MKNLNEEKNKFLFYVGDAIKHSDIITFWKRCLHRWMNENHFFVLKFFMEKNSDSFSS